MTRRKSRWWLATAIGALAVLFGASIAMAAELEDGEYTLTVPGAGTFQFTVDSESDDGDTIEATAAPEGYEIDDNDPDKVAWKNAATLEVEVKTDKVEAHVTWSDDDNTATLSLPGGGSITVVFNTDDGTFTVEADGGWFAFGSGTDWYVADNESIDDATKFFKVEATSDGIEIIAVENADDGFLNELEEEEEEEEEEVEIEEEEEEEEEVETEEEEEEDDEGPGEGRGRP